MIRYSAPQFRTIPSIRLSTTLQFRFPGNNFQVNGAKSNGVYEIGPEQRMGMRTLTRGYLVYFDRLSKNVGSAGAPSAPTAGISSKSSVAFPDESSTTLYSLPGWPLGMKICG